MNDNDAPDPRHVKSGRKNSNGRFPMGLIYTLIILCVIIAWFAPMSHSLAKRMWPTAKKGPADSYEFISIVYTDSTDGKSIDIAQMDSQLDALRANGYSTISLNNALSLIHKGTPVPSKSILLTIDSDSRKTVEEAKRVIRNHGWNAVLFVSTLPISSHSGDALSWKQLKAVSDSDIWEVGSAGHAGTETVATDAEKKERGHFLTSQEWLADAGRLENLSEFQSRIVQDHKKAIDLEKNYLGKAPEAYAYPLGDFGQYRHPDDYAGRINLAAAASFYKLAFTSGNIGLNTIFSDPTRLNRLRVQQGWSAADLLQAIDADSRGISVVEDTDFSRYTPGWIADWGDISNTESGIQISADSKTRGARAWLAGSDLRKNFSSTIKFIIEEGDIAVYLRAAPDDSAYVLLNLTPDGSGSLSQKNSWESPIITLAETRIPIQKGKEHKLNIFVRDQYFAALLDGKPLFRQSIRLDGTPQAGHIAIGSSDKSKGAAKVVITDAVVQSCKSTLASWTLDKEYEPYIMDWVHRNSGRLTEISPPWKACKAKPGEELSGKNSIYKLLAKIYNLRITPQITIESDEDLRKWTPSYIAEQADEYGCDGIYVNFEHHSELQVAPLENWLRQTSRMFSGYGRTLLVRLPPMLERLATVNALIAVIPAVEIVTDADTKLPRSAQQTPPIQEEKIVKPDNNIVNALPVAFAIAETPGDDESSTIEARIKILRDESESAFHRGAYEKAIASFSEWHQLEPNIPRPLTRIGDALINLGYHDEAIGFYRQSLNIAPGQVDLAVRQARLLTNLNRKEAAKDLLNSYARLFPDNVDILFAQAEWLYKQDRNAEAQKRIERILTLNENNFEASLFLLRLASDETSRSFAVDRLMALSTTPEHHYDLVNAVWQYDLLTLPNSHLLVTILDDIDAVTADPRVKSIISKLRPRTEPIAEVFSRTNDLSKAWQIEGATTSIADDKITIQANPTRAEYTARLLRSERWRDSFIEADITEIKGGFWLYTRRSRNHLVRFGFDENSDRMYLQAWKGKNNDIVINRFIPWTKPKGSFKLRLEVRGNGISASIDGKQAFDVPLAIPNNFGLGWAAFAVNSRERGIGSVTLSSIKAGPLPVHLAMLPAAPAKEDTDQELKQLRSRLGTITDFSPDWFAIDANGSWNSRAAIDDGFFRLFSRYYRIRLVPTVKVANGAEVLPEDILTVTRIHDFDGLVLLFETMPPEEWFHRMDHELGAPGLDLLAISIDEISGEASMRGIAASRTLFQGAGTINEVPVIDCSDGDAPTTTTDNERAILLF